MTADATSGVDPNDARAMAEAHAARRRAVAAARGVWEQWEFINMTLERIAPQWPPRRMPAADRAILRLATWELQNTPTPPKVVIDEAIELAREFSTADFPAVRQRRVGQGAEGARGTGRRVCNRPSLSRAATRLRSGSGSPSRRSRTCAALRPGLMNTLRTMAFFAKTLDKLKGGAEKNRDGDEHPTCGRCSCRGGRSTQAFWKELEERLIAADMGVVAGGEDPRRSGEPVAPRQDQERARRRGRGARADAQRLEGRLGPRNQVRRNRPDGHHGLRRQRRGQDDEHRQADVAAEGADGQERAAGRRRHLPRRGRRAAHAVGRPIGRGHHQAADRRRPGRRRLRPPATRRWRGTSTS